MSINKILRHIIAAISIACAAQPAKAQLSITATSTTYTVDFSTTISGVNNGAFAGAGFQATPTTGQLDSNAWAITGFSDGTLGFGGTRTTANTDYTRGTTLSTTGGIYGVTNSGNTFLAIRPGSSDFSSNGTVTLQISNNTGIALTSFTLGYDIMIRNDQGRSNSLNFSWATGAADTPGSFTSQSSLDYTSTAAADGSPAWNAVARSITISANVAAGSSLFLRWTGNDVAGSGSRDAFGIDNIAVSAVPEPSTYAAIAGVLALGGVMWHRRRQRTTPKA